MRALATDADDRASLRGRARRIRDAVPPADRARLSARICGRARTLLTAAGAHTVMVYVSFRSEVETAGLIDELRRTHRVAAPRVADAGCMDAMLLGGFFGAVARFLVTGWLAGARPRRGRPSCR